MSPTNPSHRKRLHDDSDDSIRKVKKSRDGRKRKKDHKDDSSRKRHKRRRKGKDHHHHSHTKSSDKQKTRKKVSRRKHDRSSDGSTASSSPSSSSTSIDRNRHHRHRHSRHKNRIEDRLKADNEKRLKSNNGTLGNDHHREPEDQELSNWIYEAPLKLAKSVLERHGTMSESSSPSAEEDGQQNLGAFRTADCCLGEKELSLEISLRQKALANFMKHQINMDAFREKSVSATCLDNEGKAEIMKSNGINNKNQAYAVCIDGNLASSNAFNMNVLEEKYCVASDTISPVQRTTIEDLSVVDRNLEEGEISRNATKIDSEISGRNNASPPKDEISYKRVEEMSQECSRDEHKLVLSGNVHENLNMLSKTKLLPSISKDVLQHSGSIDLSNEQGFKSEQVPEKMKDVEGLQISVQEKPVEITGSAEVDDISREMNRKPSSLCISEMQNGEQENGSGFQQKTISVMRGGDLVQVNYKVYIPKRAVELARRRKLKR